MYCYFLYCGTVLSRKVILDISTDIRNPASTNNYANEKWQLQFPWNSSNRKLSFIHNNCFTNSNFFPCQCYSLGSGGFWSFYLEVSKLAWFYKKKKVNEVQENCCIFWIDIAWGLQKLGIILENEVHITFQI